MTARLLFGSGTDETPNQFTFTDVTGVNPNTVTTSGMVTVTGLSPNLLVTVTASGGTVDAGTSSLSGTFASSKSVTTDSIGTFVMAARATSSGSFSTAVNVLVTVNDVSDTFSVTTRAADTTPNAYTFTERLSAELNTVYSTSVIPSGYDYASWSVSGGEGSTDNTNWTSSGTINSGETFYIRRTSSSSYSTAVNAVALIGGVSATFTITTRAQDDIPNSFSFTDINNASLATQYTSNTVTISGFDPNISVTVTASGGTVDAGTSALSGTFASSKTVTTSGSGTIVVAARLTSSSSYSTPADCTVTVGGVSDTYTVTTQAADTTPNSFSFTDVTGAEFSTVYTSNTLTLSGMSPGVSVTVTASGGTVDAGTTSLSGSYDSSKTVTTSGSGTIVIAARVTSSGSGLTAVNCTVSVDGVSDTYTVTTKQNIVGEAVFLGQEFGVRSTSWTVPSGVTSCCIFKVNAGSVTPSEGSSAPGGLGGATGYSNNISVSPGQVISISLGARNLEGYYFTNVTRSGTALANNVIGNSGNGGSNSGFAGGGGGGAAGYGQAGGNGGNAGGTGNGASGNGGGGGGGASRPVNGGPGGAGGGGVGLYGQGSNGSGGTRGATSSSGGGGGSGGNAGQTITTSSGSYAGTGGDYGGGAGGPSTDYAGNNGGRSAVRIIWGAGRSFPNNAT